ncbi:hypothetical protein BDA96_01G098800 [Sorghum bicolor]|uniref:Pentacotripeptide-repeat region of PRORP domain-containing protein n=1 Tax=Sorghum bicolor TaxID=4558 RepID=A0A921RXX3_SORBI|nr:hypothetical protein BDA96_01G098800 [Sorghum bicolor]
MAASAAAGRKWDPTVSLRLGHPALVLLERCRGARPFRAILAHLLRLGLALETFPMSRLLHFATAVSSPRLTREAELLFHHFTPRPNLYIYNLMLSASAASAARDSSSPPQAAAVYRSMLASSVLPDEQTFLALLRSVERLSAGRQVHAHVVVSGFHSRVYLRNSLIKMYIDAGDVETAELMFRSALVLDTVSCNIMLSGYVNEGCSLKALCFFRDMASRGIVADRYTAVALLTCCGRLKTVLLGRSVHGVIVRRMDAGDNWLILVNALLDMYAKCGRMNAAERVFGEASEKDGISWNTMVSGFANAGMLDLASRFFSEAPSRDLISWNALLAGYARYKGFNEVMKLFHDMLASCVNPDKVTAVTLISVAAGKGSLNHAKSIHGWVVKQFGHQDAFLGSALVDMYCKCGNVKVAYYVFEKALDKDVTLWTAMISGLAFNGHGTEALELFWKMQTEAIAPNGKLIDALALARRMPMRPSRSIWGSILNASLAGQNTEVAEIASKELLRLDPEDEGHWNHSDEVRQNMKRKGVKKSAGASNFGC